MITKLVIFKVSLIDLSTESVELPILKCRNSLVFLSISYTSTNFYWSPINLSLVPNMAVVKCSSNVQVLLYFYKYFLILIFNVSCFRIF